MTNYHSLLDEKPKVHTPSIPDELYVRIKKQLNIDSDKLVSKWIKLAVEKMVTEMETGLVETPPVVPSEASQEVKEALHLFRTIRGSAQKGLSVLGSEEDS